MLPLWYPLISDVILNTLRHLVCVLQPLTQNSIGWQLCRNVWNCDVSQASFGLKRWNTNASILLILILIKNRLLLVSLSYFVTCIFLKALGDDQRIASTLWVCECVRLLSAARRYTARSHTFSLLDEIIWSSPRAKKTSSRKTLKFDRNYYRLL